MPFGAYTISEPQQKCSIYAKVGKGGRKILQSSKPIDFGAFPFASADKEMPARPRHPRQARTGARTGRRA